MDPRNESAVPEGGLGAPPGEEFTLSAPARSFVGAAWGVLSRPAGFFRGLPRQGGSLNPLVFALVCVAAYTTLAVSLNLLLVVLGVPVPVEWEWTRFTAGFFVDYPGAALVSVAGGLAFRVLFAAVFLYAAASTYHLLVLLLVRPLSTGFQATFRAISYAAAATLLAWLPVVGSAFVLYGLYLQLVGIRELHSTSTAKAAAVVLTPVLLLGVGISLSGAALAASPLG